MYQRSTIPAHKPKIVSQLSILLTMLILIVVLAACGESNQPPSGGNTNNTGNNTNTGTQQAPASGPCSLVTKEEMAQIIGKELIAEPKEETQTVEGLPGGSVPVCSYLTAEGSIVIGWQKSQGKQAYTASQTFMRGQPGYADLSGVGESAFTLESTAYVLKGDSLLVIVSALSDQSRQAEVLKQVAQTAANRM